MIELKILKPIGGKVILDNLSLRIGSGGFGSHCWQEW